MLLNLSDQCRLSSFYRVRTQPRRQRTCTRCANRTSAGRRGRTHAHYTHATHGARRVEGGGDVLRVTGSLCFVDFSETSRSAPQAGSGASAINVEFITLCARAVHRCPAAAQPRRVRPRSSHLAVAPLSCPLAPHSHAWRGSGACSAGPCPRMGTNPPIDARRSIATRTYTRTAHTIAASRTSPLAMLSLAETATRVTAG